MLTAHLLYFEHIFGLVTFGWVVFVVVLLLLLSGCDACANVLVLALVCFFTELILVWGKEEAFSSGICSHHYSGRSSIIFEWIAAAFNFCVPCPPDIVCYRPLSAGARNR